MADDRGARLLADLDNTFKRDPDIDEYDVLPVLEPSHNRSPFLLQDHKLGVESWAVKILVKYAALRLNGWRCRRSEEQLTDLLDVCHLSRAVLLFSPEVYTAWNIRKELTEQGCLGLCEDLKFGALVLSKHPNSSETFVHRRWLLGRLLVHYLSLSTASSSSHTVPASDNSLFSEGIVSGPASDNGLHSEGSVGVTLSGPTSDNGLHSEGSVGVTLSGPAGATLSGPAGAIQNGALALEPSRLMRSHTERELSLCGRAADRYACNYHAWSHRIWVMKHCLNFSLEAVLSELKTTESWTALHISDHSGFNYRQFLLSELHDRHIELASVCLCDSRKLLLVEMSQICNLIHSFPGHETLWSHRRFVFQALLQSEQHDVKSQKHLSNGHIQMTETAQHNDWKSFYILREIDHVTDNDSSDSHTYQQTLMQKYVHWLQRL